MSSHELYFDDVELGDDVGPVERTITGEQVRSFVGLWGGDSSPNRFTSDQAAIDEGLPGAIVPGAMSVGIVAHAITGWAPNVTLRTLDLVFRQMVRHNVPYQLGGIVTDKDEVDGEPQLECDVWMEGPDGTRLVMGKATVVLSARG